MGFNEDIRSRDTNLFPVVVIGGNIYLSTNSITLNDAEGNAQYFRPILLNVPSLKESIDIQKRLYKISSMTIDISNYEHNGERFSDIVANRSLINEEVNVYWVSPSVTLLGEGSGLPRSSEDLGVINEAKLIYKGKVHRYDMGSDSIRLSVEDRSQEKLHKDLPLSALGDGVTIPNKYKNAKIPIVYGEVDGSPCVVSQSPFANDENIGSGDIILKVDSDDRVIVRGDDPVKIYGEKFINIPSEATEYNFGGEFNNFKNGRQWELVGNSIHFNTKGGSSLDPDGETTRFVPLSINMVIANDRVYPVEAIPENNIEDGVGVNIPSTFNSEPIIKFSQYTPSNKMITFSGTIVNESADDLDAYSQTSSTEEYCSFHNIQCNDVSHFPATENRDFSQLYASIKMDVSTIDKVAEKRELNVYAKFNTFNANWYEGSSKRFRLWIEIGTSTKRIPLNSDSNTILEIADADEAGTYSDPFVTHELEYGDIAVTTSAHGPFLLEESFRELILMLHHKNIAPASFYGECGLEVEFPYLYVNHHMLIDDMQEQDYYANVNGRLGARSTMPEIINDIMKSELNADVVVETGLQEYKNWLYSFTITEKVNSKSLIENLSSVSPYIPHYNNLNDFKFDVIRSLYNGSEENTTILSSDCIKWSYKRTKIEEVFTSIEYQYSENYATGNFEKSATNDIESLLPGYANSYYGLDASNEDSKLIIEDDRSKFIRDSVTAENYAKWMLFWHCNQHLIIKARLPLQYLNIEVGSLVTFDNILGEGVKPFGIDYKKDTVNNGLIGDLLNGQQVFPVFLCTSTNKTLEYIEIEVIQLHNLHGEPVPSGAILGVTDEDAWNYDPNATFNYGQPVYASDFFKDGCSYFNYPDSDIMSTNYDSEISDQVEEGLADLWSIDTDTGLLFRAFQAWSGADASLERHPSGEDYNGDDTPYGWWKNRYLTNPSIFDRPRIYLGSNCYWDVQINEIVGLNLTNVEGEVISTFNGDFTSPELTIPLTWENKERFLNGEPFNINVVLKNNPLPAYKDVLVDVTISGHGGYEGDLSITAENDTFEANFNSSYDELALFSEVSDAIFYDTEIPEGWNPDYTFVKPPQPFESTLFKEFRLFIKVTAQENNSVEIYKEVALKFVTHNPLDFNSDGFLNEADITQFINYTFSGESLEIHDINGDGGVNNIDLSAVIIWILEYGDG